MTLCASLPPEQRHTPRARLVLPAATVITIPSCTSLLVPDGARRQSP